MTKIGNYSREFKRDAVALANQPGVIKAQSVTSWMSVGMHI